VLAGRVTCAVPRFILDGVLGFAALLGDPSVRHKELSAWRSEATILMLFRASCEKQCLINVASLSGRAMGWNPQKRTALSHRESNNIR